MKYTIWQLPANHSQVFRELSPSAHFDLNDYCPVWKGKIYGEDKLDVCETIFSHFNIELPEHFAGHSLSVSDVIMIEDGEDISLYYCSIVGFKKLELE